MSANIPFLAAALAVSCPQLNQITATDPERYKRWVVTWGETVLGPPIQNADSKKVHKNCSKAQRKLRISEYIKDGFAGLVDCEY